LEAWIDRFEGCLEPLSNFILPGGSRLSAQLHWARTVCRRAERDLVHFLRQGQVEECNRLVIYLNRTSDLLFVLARFANRQARVQDVVWQKPKSKLSP
jgi:cob(I)alamin adenosyltransferase